jgi:hypothetical protein
VQPLRERNWPKAQQPKKESQMLKVTFYVYSKLLGKEFFNVELHRSMDDAKLRACALGWTISKVEGV